MIILRKIRFQSSMIKISAAFLSLCLGWYCWLLPVTAEMNNNEITQEQPVNSQLEAEVLQIIRQHPEVIIKSFQAYQEQQKKQQQKIRNTFLSQLKTNPQSIIANAPTTNDIESKKIVIEFSDFQCPYCGEFNKTLKRLIALHPEEITLVYKHFPLITIHDEALAAARAAWAANEQGKFWPYHDALFSKQDNLGENLYLEIAEVLNLDLEQFNRDRHRQEAEIAIQQDMELAQELGIQGTPFLIINGKFYSGAISLSTLETTLDF